MLRGSCLCGNVRYSLKGSLGPITHCHCRTCRKAHAAAFSTVALVLIPEFAIDSGAELLKSFELP